MGGFNQAAVDATKAYQGAVHRIMKVENVSYVEARRIYSARKSGKVSASLPRRTRRSSHKLLVDRLIAAKQFVKQCGGLQNAVDSLKLYKELS